VNRSLRHVVTLLLGVIALVGPVIAEDAFPLRAIEFEGNQHFSSEALAELSGLEIGTPVREGNFKTALRHLNNTGVFERLEFKYAPLGDGYRLTFVVEEVLELFLVRFDGFDTPTEEIQELLAQKVPLFGDRVPPTGPMVTMIGNALQTWWTQQGNDSKIEGRLVPTGDNEFEMLFGPRQKTMNIAFVRFDNSGELEALELQRKFNQVAMGEEYTEARFKELLHHNVRPFYAEIGYMNVKFCPCETKPDPDTEGLLVQVHVDQGEIYKTGDVAWPQPMPVDPKNLSKVNQIISGGTVNVTGAYKTMADITESMKRQGFMKAQATFETDVDHEAKLVDFDIEIMTGPQYTFSRLVVQGLDILSEPAIRKRWGMKAGAPFDIQYPAFFLERVKADAMLENLKTTDWHLNVDEVKKTVDVALVFNGVERDRKLAPIIEKPETPF
jgi:outer membrane protein insertion porin family